MWLAKKSLKHLLKTSIKTFKSLRTCPNGDFRAFYTINCPRHLPPTQFLGRGCGCGCANGCPKSTEPFPKQAQIYSQCTRSHHSSPRSRSMPSPSSSTGTNDVRCIFLSLSMPLWMFSRCSLGAVPFLKSSRADVMYDLRNSSMASR